MVRSRIDLRVRTARFRRIGVRMTGTERQKGAVGSQVLPVEPDAGATVARLHRLLDRQFELYSALAAHARRQSGLIDRSEADELIGVLAQRQLLVDQIEATAKELEPLRTQWQTIVQSLPGHHRAGILRKIEQMEELIAEIAERDRADEDALAKRRNRIADELASLSRASGAVEAYGRAGGLADAARARFQDRKG